MTGNGGGGAGGDGGNSNDNNSNNSNSSNNSGGGNGGGGGFMAALDEGNRTYAQSKGLKDDANAILGSYRNLEAEYSRLKSSTGPQGLSSPADYEFQLPNGIPTDGFYDKGLAAKFQTWAHKAKLSKEQAQSLHDAFALENHGLFTTAKTNQQRTFDDAVLAASKGLEKDWGSPESPGHKRAAEMARRSMSHLHPELKDALMKHGVIAKNSKGEEVVLNAPIFAALSKAGTRLFAEDDLFGAPNAQENPFDPAKPNAQKQGELVRKNPELARTLIQAAGPKVVEAWGWWLNRK